VNGLPDEKLLKNASRRKVFFDENTGEPFLSKTSKDALRVPSSKPLEEVLMC
jgi:hypothetical protein